jgi:tripartite-type tricarboxylate transporter receptor subunit TctC
VPSATPRAIVSKLSVEIHKALESPDMKERLLGAGLDPATLTLDELPAFMKREQERYASVIRNANIKLE